MNEAIRKVIDLAYSEVGYLEKASNKQLDDKTANAGKANYTKYARDMDAATGYFNGKKQSVAWCAVFVNWLFYQVFGMAAKKMLFQPDIGNCAAGCGSARSYFNKNGHLHDTPEPGDQVFFWSSDMSKVSHTGLVVDVDGERIHTVEGNTSDGTSVVANGGAVCSKSYPLGYKRIAGYGRPDWSKSQEKESDPVMSTEYSAEVFAANGKPVNLRASMSTSSRVICQIPVGKQVKVTEEHDKWARVTYQSDTTGYMLREYLLEPGTAPAGSTVTMDRTKLQEIRACLTDSLAVVNQALGLKG